MAECVERCATVGQSIIHTPWSAFQWFLPEKESRSVEQQAKASSPEIHVSAHSHIQVGGMIHIQTE